MCIPFPGRVVALDAGAATVETNGRLRRAQTLVVPDVQVGDWVLVASGTVLRRLDADEAESLRELLMAAGAPTGDKQTSDHDTNLEVPDA